MPAPDTDAPPLKPPGVLQNKPDKLSREELERRNAELEARVRELDGSRAAMLHMLEDLERERRETERARHEWIAAFDVMPDPVFVHDPALRLVRANRAYLAHASAGGMQEVLGRPYWEVFPKLDGPLAGCQRSLAHHQAGEEEVVLPGGGVFISRTFPIHDPQGTHLYSLHVMEDITERRRIEAEQRLLSEALRQTAECVVMTDRELRIRYVNPPFQHLFGYTPEEILGQPLAVLSAPGQDDHLQPLGIAQSLHPTEGWKGDVLRRTKDGAVIPMLLHAAVVRDDRGGILGYLGTYIDLREAKQAEQALRESEEKFRCISAAAQDAILMMDNDGRISLWNEAAERIFGYTAAETLGKGLHTLLAPRRFYEDYRRGFAHFRDSGEGPAIGQTLELAAIRKDGTEFPIELSVSAVRLKDKWHGIGVLRDITRRKRAEEALRAEKTFSDQMIESLPGAFYLFDSNGRFLRWNRNFETVSGYTGSEIGHMNPADFFTGLDKVRVTERIAEAFTKGIATVEADLVTKDGRRIPYFFTGVRTVLGDKPHLVGMGIDVSDRRQAGAALERRAEMERLASEISARFLSLPAGEIDEGIDHAVRAIALFAGADRGVLFRFSPDGARLTLTHEWRAAGVPALLGRLQDIPAPSLPWFTAQMAGNRVVRIPRLTGLPPEAAAEKTFFEAERIQSLLAMPMAYGGAVVGFLGLDAVRGPRDWSEEDAALLRMSAGVVANALERKRVDEQLKASLAEKETLVAKLNEMAVHDGLTELYNHRAFHSRLEEALALARRYAQPVSLLMIDIDHFKRVNDTHGHLAGDVVLRGLASLLGQQVRAVDSVCRYGGEEITVILPQTNLGDAVTLAERIRQAVEAHVFEADGQRIRITVSIGVAAFPAHAADSEALVAAADRMLYAAKEAGRNRVLAGPPAPGSAIAV